MTSRAFFLALAACGSAAAAPARGASSAGITEYTLPNGLRVLLAPDPSSPTVTASITYLVGSADEGRGEAGLAHLLEHMMFKGTPRHRSVMQLIEARGGTVEGSTSFDRTNFGETLPATADNLAWAIGLEADRMRHASISADDLASERQVVRNELERGENNPSQVLGKRLNAAAFLWHGYGRATIGARSDVEAAAPERLRAFYDTYYRPDNAVLVVAGKFDPPAALALIDRELGPIARPAAALPVRATVEPPQDGERSVAIRRVGGAHVVGALYHAAPGASPELPAVQAIADLLVRDPSGRLYRALVEPGLAADVSAYASRLRDPGTLLVHATVRDPRNVDRVEQILVRTIEELAAHPPTPAELDRFRSSALRRFDDDLATGARLAAELTEWSALGDWRLAFAWRARVAALAPDDIARVARAYLRPANRTTGRVVPMADLDRAPLPERPDVARIVAATAAVPPIAPAEPFAATLPAIASRLEVRELPGGLRGALLAKQTRGGRVTLALTLRHGDERSLAGKDAVAQLLGRLALRGSTSRSHQDVLDLAAKLRADLAIDAGLDRVTLTLTTVRANLVPALALAADLLIHPRLDPGQLAIVRRARIAELERERAEPTRRGERELERLLRPGRRATVDEELAALQAVTPAALADFHRRFWGTGHGELVAIGDFDRDQLVTALRDSYGLAGWTSRAPYQRLADRVIAVSPGDHDLAIGDKRMGLLAGGYRFEMRDDDPDHAAVAIAVLALGGSTAGRLNLRLRERDGLSVGAWASLDVSPTDRAADFRISAMIAPANADRARRALDEELARFVHDGITAAELAAAKQAWTDQLDAVLADDAALGELLARDASVDRPLTWHAALRDRIRALTVADVNRAIRARLMTDRMVWLRAR